MRPLKKYETATGKCIQGRGTTDVNVLNVPCFRKGQQRVSEGFGHLGEKSGHQRIPYKEFCERTAS